jgi:pimeloyl-ACP methyl ester carboxylesterase
MNDVLPKALPLTRREIDGPAGRISYYAGGDGPPLLLLHSINAAASAAEMAPLHTAASGLRRVYTADLPGFGFSERGPRDYRPELYVRAIEQMLGQIAADHGEAPVDAAALSLSSEFLASAALRQPTRFRSLTLISPTGFRRRDLKPAASGTREIGWLYRLLRRESLGEFLFRRLTRPDVVRYFLERTWGSKDIDESLWRYCVLTARQPGARHAPIAFLSGRLFSTDARERYQKLTLPVWMPHGTRGDFADFRGAGWTGHRPNWQVDAYQTGALPHFEDSAHFGDAFRTFLNARR